MKKKLTIPIITILILGGCAEVPTEVRSLYSEVREVVRDHTIQRLELNGDEGSQ